ncbi:hypothetical protein NUM_66640 [Actinocatenispora comari]|uniref:Uncharacterized protein n=1 Tax=Actinocatenispora comari TaxID=2807577 RepID=A0A8J4AIW8_9ACTN|nr:hypothetical protein NUM_66640 [Actinocatenispora comari]
MASHDLFQLRRWRWMLHCASTTPATATGTAGNDNHHGGAHGPGSIVAPTRATQYAVATVATRIKISTGRWWQRAGAAAIGRTVRIARTWPGR